MGRHAVPEIYNIIRQHKTSIIFVNTRAQAELAFDALWRINDENLSIGLHHGSLAVEQRRKVEAAMSAGRATRRRGDLVARSRHRLGDVDLVIQMGAPKGVSRLMQRIGRANHRLDEPSRAMIAPANRFEVLESLAALEAVEARELDGDPPRPPCLDVLAQHIVGTACAQPIDREAFFAEVRRAQPYRDLSRQGLRRYVRLRGDWRLRARRLRSLAPAEEVAGRTLDAGLAAGGAAVPHECRHDRRAAVDQGEDAARPGAGRGRGGFHPGAGSRATPSSSPGRLLRFEGVKELMAAICSVATGGDPKVPAYGGGRLPLSTFLARSCARHPAGPGAASQAAGRSAASGCASSASARCFPVADKLLVEGFPRGGKQFLVAYCFEGRNAHQTLGMLLTRRMERMGLRPLGFVATDYVLGLWGLRPASPKQLEELFDEDMLGDDLEAWMDESSMLRRSFRNVAVIAGLIERRFPGEEKSRRQVTFSSDLIYDTLRQHEPNHILLRATRQDAAWQLADLKRLGDLLRRAKGRIVYRRLDRISPLAVPVLLEIGKERVLDGTAEDELLDIAAQELIDEATRL
jgi:ATP-dependent Lhr-like helicase